MEVSLTFPANILTSISRYWKTYLDYFGVFINTLLRRFIQVHIRLKTGCVPLYFNVYTLGFKLTCIPKSCFFLCWGVMSQSTIFQSCRDRATASWVINQYFRGVKCLAQRHNTAAVGIEPPTSCSGVRHSTTEPPRSPYRKVNRVYIRSTHPYLHRWNY